MKAFTAVDSGTANRANSAAVDMLAQRLANGVTVQRYPGGDLGDCLAATWRGRGEARILVIAHLDTVYPDGTAAARPLRIEGDRAIGPGACDLKGGFLVGLYALAQLRRLNFDNFAELTFFAAATRRSTR